MSTNFFYEKVLPDTDDPDNETGKHPGFVVNIGERDGAIVIGSVPHSADYHMKPEGWRYVVVNPDEAEEIIIALREAMRAAGKKPDGTHWHPRRTRNP